MSEQARSRSRDVDERCARDVEAPPNGRHDDGRGSAAPLLTPPGLGESRMLIAVVALLLVFGLVMAFSASIAGTYFHEGFKSGATRSFLLRQGLIVAVALAAMWVTARFDYTRLKKHTLLITGIGMTLLALVLIPGIGVSVKGARRWISLGVTTFQPSELAKLAAVILVAGLIAARPEKLTRLRYLLFVTAAGIVPGAALIMLEPDLGSTLVLTLAVGIVLIAGGARLRHLIGIGTVLAAAAVLLIVMSPYRMDRVETFMDPWSDPAGEGFQATQSMLSFASGGFFGVGLGNSVQKYGFVPEQDTDMITAIIAEELGLLGILALTTLFILLAYVGLRIAANCKDPFGKLVATGIVAVIVGQAALNLAAATGLVPLTGVPMPFVSLGGTSLVVVFAGLGILLNIATNRRSFIAVSPEGYAHTSGGRRDGRTPAAGAGRRR